WAKNVYPIGIFLMLLMILLLGIFGWDGTRKVGNWLAGLIAILLALGIFWLSPRVRILNPVRAHWVRPTNPSWFDWISQAVWALYRQLRRLSFAFTNLLEGESGIMWTLLFLALFISLFTQRTP